MFVQVELEAGSHDMQGQPICTACLSSSPGCVFADPAFCLFFASGLPRGSIPQITNLGDAACSGENLEWRPESGEEDAHQEPDIDIFKCKSFPANP